MQNVFGNMLQRIRRERKLTIRGLASRLEISPTYLCDLEAGDRKLTSDNDDLFKKIIQILEINGEELDELIQARDAMALESNRLSPDLAQYLRETPAAQAALRKAMNNNVSNEEWGTKFKE